MIRKLVSVVLLLGMMGFVVSCSRTNKHVQNPIANVNSAQPDKVLFDRAMDAMKHNKFDVARLTLQTLINTYPDSEYVARAKLAIGDSWYAEGGSAGLAQAEIEYKDFITFFPNMPEAAEAQLKVANIHYRQMEKPDRDFTHAKRAEEEYKQLVLQFPDSKLVPEAKQRLRDVQEVLAEREYRIGRFYFLRESWLAAIARLKSVTDTYPLYSGADDALYLLGQAYENEAQRARLLKMNEAVKARMVREFEDEAAAAYSRILTRYPVMPRSKEAKERLEAIHRPVPTATQQAIAQNKTEEESRRELGRFSRMWGSFHRRPDVSEAAKVGEPTLVPPKQTSATEISREVQQALMGAAQGSGQHTVSVEAVGTGAPPPSQPVPRSSDAASPDSSGDKGIPELAPTANESAPAEGQAPLPPPSQVNEANNPPGGTDSAKSAPAAAGQNGQLQKSDENTSSSSKSKKKKGLRKLIPF